jgi:SAM-dependent methyltransferase
MHFSERHDAVFGMLASRLDLIRPRTRGEPAVPLRSRSLDLIEFQGVGTCNHSLVSDYLTVNLANWNSRVRHHANSYPLGRFRSDPSYLSDVVRFDLPRLGDVQGLDIVHLQCHIGTDTLSLARLGAHRVTGVDFSRPALDVAAALAADCSAEIEFVESELYKSVEAVGSERFDLVFTGIGALCWLPDIRQWAEVVAALLRPGGRLFMREGHPMLWALADPRPDGLLSVEFPYFETEGVPFSEPFSYQKHDEPLDSPDIIHFNHGLGEIVSAVMGAGLSLTALEEHDSVPWNPLGDAMEAVGGGEYRLRSGPARLAATYTLQARKV